MAKWSFLTNHAAAMVCIAHDPGVRLRDIAGALEITERSAFGIVTELVQAGYVVKEREGRRNRYRIQGHLPMRDSVARERTIGEILDVLVKDGALTDTEHPAREPGASTRGLLGRGDAPDEQSVPHS
jgi:DNA-binding IscR family transcriptional regulator